MNVLCWDLQLEDEEEVEVEEEVSNEELVEKMSGVMLEDRVVVKDAAEVVRAFGVTTRITTLLCGAGVMQETM